RIVYFVKPPEVVPPKAIYQPDPSYDPSARAERRTGTVKLSVIISEYGVPEVLQLEEGAAKRFDFPSLPREAKCRFEPAKRNGIPVLVTVNVEINFRLR